MKYFYLYCLAGVMIILAGCAPSASITIGNRSATFDDVREAVSANQVRIRTMRSEGQIYLETPTVSQGGSFSLLLRKPDSILVTLQGPFGIKVGSALLTKNEFLFYNSFENKLITGTTNAENVQRIFHIHLEFDDILALFSGGCFLSDDLRAPDIRRVEDNQFLFIYDLGHEKRQYWIDPVTLLIQKTQLLDDEGKLVFEIRFSHFQTVQGASVPYSIQVTQTHQRQRLTLSYSDVELNNDALEFTFTVPKNAERIRW